MRRIYVEKSGVREALAEITRQQQARGVFVNVQVKPYRGKKFDSDKTAVIVMD